MAERITGGPNRRQSTRHAWARRLVIMVKAPATGRVKTRLGREIGAVPATALYRRLAAATLRRLSHDPRWQTLLAVAPDTATRARFWPHEIPRVPQGRGDLGDRLDGVMQALPPGPVIVIGTDIPLITPAQIARAFADLGGNDAVFGPAGDGGYWLVGLRRSPRVLSIFADVRWSSPHALADTRANLAGRRVALTDILLDIDTGAEYRELGGEAGRVIPPPPRRPAPSGTEQP